MRHSVVPMASEVLANRWIVSDFDNDLWFSLVCSEHFEWNGFVEQALACVDNLGLVGYQFLEKTKIALLERFVHTVDNSHLSLCAVLSDESDVKTDSVDDAVVVSGFPHIDSIIVARAVLAYGFANPSLMGAKINILCCYWT